MSYSNAVISPFDNDAEGAQVPDLYSFPTDTTRVRTTFTISSDAAGNFDMAILPHPMATVFTNRKASLTGLNIYNATNISNGFNNMCFYGALTDAQLTNYTRWRIVGYGLRMRSLLVPQTSTGTLFFSTIPGPEFIPDPVWLNNSLTTGGATVQQNWLENIEIPGSLVDTSTGYFSSNMISLPTGKVSEHYDFNANGLEWAGRITGPGFFEFKDGCRGKGGLGITNSNAVVTGPNRDETFGGIAINTNGSVTNWTYEGNIRKCSGGSNLLCRGSGLPASVAVASCELVLHLEYIDSGASALSGGRWPKVDTNALSVVTSASVRMPLYRSIGNAAINQSLVTTRTGV